MLLQTLTDNAFHFFRFILIKSVIDEMIIRCQVNNNHKMYSFLFKIFELNISESRKIQPCRRGLKYASRWVRSPKMCVFGIKLN